MAQQLGGIIYTTAAILLLTSHVTCQNSNDLDFTDIKKQISNFSLENGLETGLQNFNASQLPPAEDFVHLIKEKCSKSGGGEEAFTSFQEEYEKVPECIQAQLNVTQLQAEIEEAKKSGSMDEVFGKYCRKYPEIHACFAAATDKARPCLEENERVTLNQSLGILEELKEFICYKDGDRVAMFIAEGGVECLESKQEELSDCANKTLGSRIPTDFSVNTLPSFLFTQQECDDFDKIRVCFNEVLEKCKDSTPANIVDAFFKFLKKHMPCNKAGAIATGTSRDGNSSSSIVISFFVIVVSVVVSKFL